MRWRLILEEFGPELNYVQGNKNIVADALSRLDIIPTIDSQQTPLESLSLQAELFGQSKSTLPSDYIPCSI